MYIWSEFYEWVFNINLLISSSIFLEFGKPAKEGEYRIVFSVAIPADLYNDNLFHEFIEVGEFPLSGDLTGS